MSFDVGPQTVYRATRNRKSPPKPKTVCYSPQKRPSTAKTTSFDVNPETVYRGLGDPKSSPEHKNVCYTRRKWSENAKMMNLDVGPKTGNRGSRATKIVLGTRNSVLEPTKTARKRENYEFSRRPSNRLPGVTGHENRLRNPK